MPNGTAGPQQCTRGKAPAAWITAASLASASACSGTGRRFSPLAVGTPPASTLGRAGSSSCSSTCAPGTRLRTSPTWPRTLPRATGKVGHRAGVGERGILAAGQLDRGRQRPRPAHCDLQRAPVAVGGLLQRVEIGGQQATRPAQVAARAGGEPPAGGGGLHRQVDQQRGGAAGQAGAGPGPGARPGRAGRAVRRERSAWPRPGRCRAWTRSRSRCPAARETASGGVRTRPRTRHTLESDTLLSLRAGPDSSPEASPTRPLSGLIEGGRARKCGGPGAGPDTAAGEPDWGRLDSNPRRTMPPRWCGADARADGQTAGRAKTPFPAGAGLALDQRVLVAGEARAPGRACGPTGPPGRGSRS